MQKLQKSEENIKCKHKHISGGTQLVYTFIQSADTVLVCE